MLSVKELAALAEASHGRYGELVLVLKLRGLRWGELAGLQVGDRLAVPELACAFRGAGEKGRWRAVSRRLEEPARPDGAPRRCDRADRAALG